VFSGTELTAHGERGAARERSLSFALRAARIAGFAGLVALGAHAKVFLPWSPVPFTLQTFFVLLAGAFLSPAEAASAVAGYLALGALGVPLFATGGPAGLAYFLGVTGGYLAGFLAAAVLLSLAVRRFERPVAVAASFLGGALLILAFGSFHLSLVTGLSAGKALSLGALPFLPGDVLKAGLAAVLYLRLRG